MDNVINFKNGKHIKLWLPDLEYSAFEQASNVAHHPVTFRHVAIMPDAHAGKGVPIGCVFASDKAVIPNAVGVDIGCGMSAYKLNITEDDVRHYADVIKEFIDIAKILHTRHSAPINDTWYEKLMSKPKTSFIDSDKLYRAFGQISTLGGGNHFIEFQKDETGGIWLMVHSGSRNVGHQVATYYNDIAVELNAKYCSTVPKHHNLAFLPLDTKEAQDYITDMEWCVDYARTNRFAILGMIYKYLSQFFSHRIKSDWYDCTHNFAQMEHHFGKNVMVHRKGATMARNGQAGLIPGSQGTCSYVVEGLGNEDSFCSCSHGAGRPYSRSKAKELLDLDEQKAILDDQNIIHSMTAVSDLDEAPGAYKDIDVVMENQKDLVKIIHKLEPIMVVKN